MDCEFDRAAVDAPWIARCAHRLRRQWPHAELLSLEEAAAELRRDPVLGSLAPEHAAECWLVPLLSADDAEPVRREVA